MTPQSPFPIDHIGIAVADLSEAIAHYTSVFGQGPDHLETLETQGVSVAFFTTPTASIELLAPCGDLSPMAKFLAHKGPGLHHIAYLVPQEQYLLEIKRLTDLGLQPLTPAPTLGAKGKQVQFFHPKSHLGVLMELCSYA
jgi:methylmalonyl-CoA epimerase